MRGRWISPLRSFGIPMLQRDYPTNDPARVLAVQPFELPVFFGICLRLQASDGFLKRHPVSRALG
jgi:hypothetical protein